MQINKVLNSSENDSNGLVAVKLMKLSDLVKYGDSGLQPIKNEISVHWELS